VVRHPLAGYERAPARDRRDFRCLSASGGPTTWSSPWSRRATTRIVAASRAGVSPSRSPLWR